MSDTDNSADSLNSGQLPPGWTMATIGDLVKVRNGYAFKSSDYKDEGVLLIRQSNLGGEKVSLKKAKYLPVSFLENHPDFSVNKGDILIGMSGSIGKICTYDLEEPALQNQRTGLLAFKDERQRRWLWHYLPLLERDLVKVGKGVAVQNVSAKQIESFPIPIAPLEQQKRIVAEIEKQFSRLDEAVANLKCVKANLKRYKAAVLKAAVEGKLTEAWRKKNPDVEPADKLLERILAERREKWQGRGKYKEPAAPNTTDLPELPDGWVWTKSDQLLSFVTSGSRGWAKYYSKTGPVFLRMGNLDHDTISLDLSDIQRVNPPENSEGKRTRVTSGDILISITADVGMIGLVPDSFEEAYINQHVSLARPVRLDCSVFIAWFFSCNSGQNQFKDLQRGATKVGLGLDDIKEINIPLPSLQEQKAISTEIDRRFSIIVEAEMQVETNLHRADRLRQAILKKAFSGQLVASNEIAE